VATQSFIEVAHDLLVDHDAKSAFADDPQGFLTSRGLGELSPEDLHDAVGFVAEALPVPVAAHLWSADSGEEAAGHPLARLAEVDPALVEVPDLGGPTFAPPAHDASLPEEDVTSELPPTAAGDAEAGLDDDDGDLDDEASADADARQVLDTDESGQDEEEESDLLAPVTETSTGAAYGVGYTGDDVDDVSPPTVHEGETPMGFEMPALTDPVPHEDADHGDEGLDLDLDL
jgi:hypothetical protein